MTEPRTEADGGLARLAANRQMPDDARPNVTLGEIRAALAASPSLDRDRLAATIRAEVAPLIVGTAAEINAGSAVLGVVLDIVDGVWAVRRPFVRGDDMTTDNAPALTRFAKQTVHPVVVRNGMLVCESCGAVGGAASVTPPEGLDVEQLRTAYLGNPHDSPLWEEVADELARAEAKFGPMASGHEAVAVIEEEFMEFRSAVFWGVDQKGRPSDPRAEAIQLAAMAMRYLSDLSSEETT